jgi:hypothetical protein
MTTDILYRSAATHAAFDAEINAAITLAPQITAPSLGAALRLMLDRHHRYDGWFSAALQTAAALPEPVRSEACVRLAQVGGPPPAIWLMYLGALKWLRERGVEVSGLYPADRAVIADRLHATTTPTSAIPVRLAAE